MDVLGFYYDTRTDKIDAKGYPIPDSLLAKGYVQKNNSDGVPRWYVMPNKVWILLLINGKREKFDIYTNIMAIYPERERISLKLAQEVMLRIFKGEIIVQLEDGKPFLQIVEKKCRKKKTSS